ncbi:MAG TPA: hypothetical protein DCP95_03920, partial [Microbacterium ginsengisoli]|nr:hypothetical protein [Microbacterium ginsengisoli]
AGFLGGAAPVDIVAPRASKTFDLSVVVPVDDMLHPPPPPGEPPAAGGREEAASDDWFAEGTSNTEITGSVWPHVE